MAKKRRKTNRGRKGPKAAKKKSLPTPEAMAICAARAADDAGAEDIVVIDLRGRNLCLDFFVIGTGRVDTHLSGVAKEVQVALAELGCSALEWAEGGGLGGWALLDYGPLVIHVFTPEIRKYYDLELLWGDAPKVEWQ